MVQSLLDQLSGSTKDATLRPTMHLVKVYCPLIAAVTDRLSKGLRSQEIQDLVSQIDGLINSVLTANQMPIPGQEWQRATIRTALLPLCVEDVKNTGNIQADKWLHSFCELTKTLNIQATEVSFQNSQAGQVKLALSDITTSLICATSEFSFLHNQQVLVKELVAKVFSDSKEMCESIGNDHAAEKGSFMTNLLRNHAKLMIAAINTESSRVRQSLNEETIMANSEGLPLDGLYTSYEKNKSTLSNLVPELGANVAITQDSSNHKTPSFLR